MKLEGGKKDDAPRTAEGISESVLSSSMRKHIPSSLVKRLAKQELDRGRSLREAEKQVKGRLHQVVLSFEPGPKALSSLSSRLDAAGHDRALLKEAARAGLALHSSTKERLPYMEELFSFVFGKRGFSSVIDLACGLNPLAFPWMGLSKDAVYDAVDVSDLCGSAVRSFFDGWGIRGSFTQADLAEGLPKGGHDVALLMKALPTLDRIEQGLGYRCVKDVDAGHVAVSFPTASLGGRRKGMESFYGDSFEEFVRASGWTYEKRVFLGELVFLVRK